MDAIEIKEIPIASHKQEISLLMSSLQESEQGYFDKSAPWKEIEENYMSHMINTQQDCEGTCFAAYDESKIIGFIYAYLVEPDESRIEIDTGSELYVSDGFVLPQYRKQGIYKKMNVLLEDKYIQKGVKRITRFTLTNNEPMKKFLSGVGYRATRTLFEKWL